MFVFGEVQDPTPDTVNLVEDIVRSQLVELVSPRLLHQRGAFKQHHRSSKPEA